LGIKEAQIHILALNSPTKNMDLTLKKNRETCNVGLDPKKKQRKKKG